MAKNAMHDGPFTMEKLPFWYPARNMLRYLVHPERSRRHIVCGDEMAGQISLAGHALVITHYDYFDGTSTWFYLIDAAGKIIDNVSTPDYSGFIEDIEVHDTTSISFSFMGTDDRWKLQILASGRWSFSLGDLARRLNRFFWRKRYMSLTRMKKPRTTPVSQSRCHRHPRIKAAVVSPPAAAPGNAATHPLPGSDCVQKSA